MATAEVSPESSSNPAAMLPPNDPLLLQSPSTSSEENSTPFMTPKKVEPFIPRRSPSISVSTVEPPKIGQKRSLSQAEFKNLPRFTSTVPEGTSLPAPSARIPSSPSPSPKHDIIKRISRPNSPSNAGRIVLPRSRVANIRRESDCYLESEVAHERYIKTAVQVSVGLEDFSLDDKGEDRKRTKSFTDPISITILGSSFVANSAQSPKANVDQTKQCYSPATQQLVAANISYSPSPSPTPSSPKRSRVMRSMSPIVTRQISKRRYTNSGNCSGLDSDNEGPPLSSKRQCTSFSKSCGSPLVREAPTFYNPNVPMDFIEPTISRASPTPSESSTTSSVNSFFKPQSLSNQALSSSNPIDSDESSCVNDDLPYAQKDDQSSTAFSSRACTPIEESDARLPDEVAVQCTTPTGLVRTFTAGSSSPFRFALPPSPLASQRLRDASDF